MWPTMRCAWTCRRRGARRQKSQLPAVAGGTCCLVAVCLIGGACGRRLGFHVMDANRGMGTCQMPAHTRFGGHHVLRREVHVAQAMFLAMHCFRLRFAHAMRSLLRSHASVFGTYAGESLSRLRCTALHSSLVPVFVCHLVVDEHRRRMHSLSVGWQGGSLNSTACGCAHFAWVSCSAPAWSGQ